MRQSRRLLILIMALAPPLWVAFFQSPGFVMVGAVEFSPDGRALATVCDSRVPPPHRELRVWDAATGRERLRLDHRMDPPWWPTAAAWIWTAAWEIVALRRGGISGRLPT